MHSKPLRRRVTLLAAVAVTLLTAVLPAALPTASAEPRTDAYMRDRLPNSALPQPIDVGAEPNVGNVYSSPDITVCPNPTPCATDVEIVPNNTYFVYVTMRNAGPNGTGPSSGWLYLYYIGAGSDSSWPGQWVQFNTPALTTINAGVTSLMSPWTVPPNWIHYCLLARWISTTDPMTFPEGSSTETNARNNNNIAWHNVVTASPTTQGGNTRSTFQMGNALNRADRVTLAVAPLAQPFVGPGGVVVDLGPTLTDRWRAAGGQAVGMRWACGR